MLVSGDFRGWDADAEAVPLDSIDTMWLSLLGLFPLAAAAELVLQLVGLR